MRRLLLLASAMVFFDVAFFAAIAPLLPDYVDDLGLEQGARPGSSPPPTRPGHPARLAAGRLRRHPGRAAAHGDRRPAAARRLQPRLRLRRPVSPCSTSARFIQGIAGALIWSGALTWLITTAPPERRGSVIGTALGTAVAGALFGPAARRARRRGRHRAGLRLGPGVTLVLAFGRRRACPDATAARAPGLAARGGRDAAQPRRARRRPRSSPSPR